MTIPNDVAKMQFTGEAGAGLVKVTVDGTGHLIKVEIDDSIFSKENKEFVAGLFTASFNQALDMSFRKIAEAVMGKTTSIKKDPFLQ